MDEYDNNGGGFSPGVPEGQAASPPKKVTKNMLLLPTTIRQLTLAQAGIPDEHFRIDGRELGHVTFIGVIRSVTESETHLSYDVEDGTGMLEVREWIGKNESEYTAQKRASRREGLYIRVVGQLKVYHDKKHVTAFNLRPIEDFNEITHHYLEVIHAHLYNTKGPLANVLAPQKSPAKPSNLGGGGIQRHEPQYQAPQKQQQQRAAAHQNPEEARLEEVSLSIMELLRKKTREGGLRAVDMHNALNGFATLQEIETCIALLVENAHLYTSEDDQHFDLIEE